MKVENVTVPVRGLARPVRIVLAADLHDSPCEDVLNALRRDPPDMIAAAGDIVEHYGWLHEAEKRKSPNQQSARFLKETGKIAPVFYALGNHELHVLDAARTIAASTGAVLLENRAVEWNGLWIGGLTSAGNGKSRLAVKEPDLGWLAEFSALPGPKLLLCHHPEYFPHFIRKTGVDVVLSGHAHGGQWRFFGQGVFAPGQGIFPKYTSGLYENRLVVSRGLANTARVPRFGNPTALVYVTLQPAK